jgi:hypothetical protein
MQRKKIETLKDLRDEKKLVQERIYKLEQDILKDVEDIRRGLETWSTAGSAIKSLITSNRSGVMNESIGSVVDAFIKKIVLRKSNFITRFVVSFLLKNFARNYLEKNSDKITEKIKKLVTKITDREKEALAE